MRRPFTHGLHLVGGMADLVVRWAIGLARVCVCIADTLLFKLKDGHVDQRLTSEHKEQMRSYYNRKERGILFRSKVRRG
jgi:hypothetical protein